MPRGDRPEQQWPRPSRVTRKWAALISIPNSSSRFVYRQQVSMPSSSSSNWNTRLCSENWVFAFEKKKKRIKLKLGNSTSHTGGWKTRSVENRNHNRRPTIMTIVKQPHLNRNYYEMEIKLRLKFWRKIKAERRTKAERERVRHVGNDREKHNVFFSLPLLVFLLLHSYNYLSLLFHLIRGIWPKDQSRWRVQSHTVWDLVLRRFTPRSTNNFVSMRARSTPSEDDGIFCSLHFAF